MSLLLILLKSIFLLFVLVAMSCENQSHRELKLTPPNPGSSASAPANHFDSRQSSAIVGGTAVAPADPVAQSTVAIYAPLRNGSLVYICTGVLIEPDVVLTATHCLIEPETSQLLQADYLLVNFGVKKVTKLDSQSTEFRAVLGVIVHPEFNGAMINIDPSQPIKDLALLKLKENAPKWAKPIELLTNGQLIQKGVVLTIAGFGRTQASDESGGKNLMKATVEVSQPHMNPTQFSFNFGNGKGSCVGDSGGPAFYQDQQGSLLLAGIDGWGDEECARISTYTSVSTLLPWIREQLVLLDQKYTSASPSQN